jgi:mRNA-degrading endonuclease YafQ of YafQ-DinJ toxin-antitoxin module
MSFTLVFTDDYTRRTARFIKRHPEIKAQYGKTLELLESNPYHPSLRLHALRGRLQGLHAVFMILETEVVLVDVGSHDDVY